MPRFLGPKPRRRAAAVAVSTAFLCLGWGGKALAQGSVAGDKAALEALYDATGGAGWTDSSGWKTTNPLGDWHGVTTNSDGRVTKVALFENDLDGSIPSALGDLTELEELWLRHNDNLSGSLPSALGNLSNLTHFDAADTSLSGSIPATIGNLSNLTGFDVSDSSISGTSRTRDGTNW